MKFTFLFSFTSLMVAFLVNGCHLTKNAERQISDENFIMRENILSPDGKSRILIYQYDIGALGYNRVFWAVTPTEFQNLNLAEYELPDGYRTEGWTTQNELQISRWQTNYGVDKSINLNTGDIFRGIKVKLVENCSKYPLGKENC